MQFAALLTVLVSSLVVADATPTTAQLQAEYDTRCAQLVHGDLAAWATSLAPTFSSLNQGVITQRAQFIANVKSVLATMHLQRCTTAIDAMTPQGAGVVVTEHQAFYGFVPGKKASQNVVIEGGGNDVWSDAGGTLLLESSVGIWGTVSVNGTVVRRIGAVPSPSPAATP